jgi:hypothetical protein
MAGPPPRLRVEAAFAADPRINALFAIGPGGGEALDVMHARGRVMSWTAAWGRSPEYLALLSSGLLNLVAGDTDS